MLRYGSNNVPQHTLAYAHYGRCDHQFHKIEDIGWQLTFSVDPKEGTWSRQFPFRECITLNEPICGPVVPRSAGNVVIFPWIRRGEPASNVILQLIACQIISEIHITSSTVEIPTFQLVDVACQFM
jgi:hypothetical protein